MSGESEKRESKGWGDLGDGVGGSPQSFGVPDKSGFGAGDKGFGFAEKFGLSDLLNRGVSSREAWKFRDEASPRINGPWLPSISEFVELDKIASRMGDIGKGPLFSLSAEDYQKLKTAGLRIFERFDSDKSNTLSDEELGKALSSEHQSLDESKAAASLFLARDLISKLAVESASPDRQSSFPGAELMRSLGGNRTQIGRESIDRLGDLNKFKRAEIVLEKLSDTAGLLRTEFKNKDVSKAELEEAIQSGRYSNPRDLDLLTFARDNFAEIKNFADGSSSADGTTLTAVNLRTLESAAANFQGKRLLQILDNVSSGIERVSTLDPESDKLFGKTGGWLKEIIFPTGPRKEAVQMGGLYSCHLMASLAGLNENTIKGMLKENRDGTVTVKFPGDPNNPVTVEKPSLAMRAAFNQAGGNGYWASVLESAADRYFHSKLYGNDAPYVPGKALLEKGNVDGVVENMHLLTGKFPQAWDINRDTLGETLEALKSAQSDGRAVSLATRDRDIAFDLSLAQDKLPIMANHAYTFLSSYQVKDGNLMLRLRDPFGSQSRAASTDGVFEINAEQFKKYFALITTEGTEAATRKEVVDALRDRPR